jgi:hypothetical protein
MHSKQSKQVLEYLKVEQIFGSKRSVQYAIGVSFRARQTLSRGEPLGVCKKGRVMPPIDRGIPYSSVLLDGRRVGVWRHRSALVWDHGGLSFGLDATVMDDRMLSTGRPSVTSNKELR